MPTRTSRLGLLTGAALLALTGLAAARTTEVGTPREQTLIVDTLWGHIPNPTQMNPFVEGVTVAQGLSQLVLSPLWEIDTTTGKQFPAMAATMPEALDDSFTHFRFKTRQGLAWSDGVPFTAADVVFTAKMLMATPALPMSSYLRGLIKDIRQVDDNTVELDTNNPSPKLSMALGVVVGSNNFRIVPEHIWSKVDPATFTNYPPVGIGAYKFKALDPNGYWVLWEKRDDWQKSDAGQIKGEPKPQYVFYRSYGPEEKRVIAMSQNDMDLAMPVTPESFDILRSRNKYVHAWSDKFPYANMDDPCDKGIHFNLTTAPYDKWQVRWALALATNLQKVNMATLSGMLRAAALAAPPISVLTKTYYQPMVPWLTAFALPDGYKPFDPDYALTMGDALRRDGVDGVPDDAQGERDLFGVGWWKFDPVEAGKLLESVGFRKSGGKWLLPDGSPWTMTINAPADFEILQQRLAFAVADQWRAFGVDAQVRQEQSGPFFTDFATGNFQAGSYWSGSCAIGPDLFGQLEQWHRKYIKPTGTSSSFNRERLDDADVSAAIDELSRVPSDDPKITQYGQDFLKAMVKAMPAIQMFGTSQFVPVNTYYWDNEPSATNYYEGPWWWWSTFKYILPSIQPTGRK
jgi:peptide/nickel transport system substrate-binding protein